MSNATRRIFLFLRSRLSSSKGIIRSAAGFTLLELMVVFSLSALMAGGGFFAFTQYARSQAFNQGIEQVRLTYEQARNFAISNVKPEDECSTGYMSTSTLRGYKVNLTASSVSLVIGCSTGDTAKSQQLPSGVRLRNVGGGGPTACSGIEFQALTGNVKPTGGISLPCDIEIYHESDSVGLIKLITIARDGRLVFSDATP